jgi:hypothetical protein
VPSILSNDYAEASILAIRAARVAQSQHLAERVGAFLVFPTSIVNPGPRGGQLVFPLCCDTEPGTVVTGPGRARVAGKVAGVTVDGTFSWTLGAEPPVAACYRFTRQGLDVPAPPWVAQLPASQALAADDPAALARRRSQLRRGGRDAEHRLLNLTEQVLRRSCRGPISRALRYRPVIDIDDLVQRSLQTAARLLPVYASDQRPPCSWLGMLRLDARRDLLRELSRLDPLPANMTAALALADACGIDLRGDPAGRWPDVVDVARRLGRPVPRVTGSQLVAAVRAPAFAAKAAAALGTLAGPDIDDETGLAAAVARLVADDPTSPNLAALAAAGDPRALRQIGERVVRGLNPNLGSLHAARRELWSEFQQTGRLFSTPAGKQRYGDRADPDTLQAIDAAIQGAVTHR